jgi:putative DNA primase/helicase
MLIEDYGADIRYCLQWKKWLIWDGRRWNKKNEYGIYFLAKKTVYEMHEKALKKNSEDDTLVFMEHAVRSESTRKLEAMVKNAIWEESLWIEPENLDQDKMIFNCANGSIDLTSGRLLEHERRMLITKISPVEYDVNAECPMWIEFLRSIFRKNKALIKFVQKITGICLTGNTTEQAMFILYGTGANGKSTFLDIILSIMGDYGATTPTETLMQKKGESSSNDIARLQGTRFVSAMESDIGGKLAEAVVKRLTGNDKIIARFLYGEYFEFKPTFKIFMATNHKPKVTGMDEAIWRRLRLIPFDVCFKKKEQDPDLPEKLMTELPGILAWMVEGCLLWKKEGLRTPSTIIEANNQYRNEMSAIETFLEECCKRDPYAMIQASHLYEAYKKWAENNNEHIISMRSLGMRLAESGMDKTRLSSGNHWLGIALKNEI